MLGNVTELTQDCHERNYEQAFTDGSAWEPMSWFGECARVQRGGSWFSDPKHLRAANRSYAPPNNSDSRTGFRLARTLFTP